MFSLAKLSPTVTDMIRFDHSHVFVTFHQFTQDKSPTVKKALSDTICAALEIHATLEEEIFYPVMQTIDPGDSALEKAPHEHADMKRLIRELRTIPGTDDLHDRVLLELMREVIHHVADEETVLLPAAERKLSKERLIELGVAMNKRRIELLAPQAGKVAISHAVGFSGSTAAWVLGAAGAIGAMLALSAAGRKAAVQVRRSGKRPGPSCRAGKSRWPIGRSGSVASLHHGWVASRPGCGAKRPYAFSARLAMMKSRLVRPPASWVVKRMFTVRYTFDHSGWWLCFSAASATSVMNENAWTKSAKTNSRSIVPAAASSFQDGNDCAWRNAVSELNFSITSFPGHVDISGKIHSTRDDRFLWHAVQSRPLACTTLALSRSVFSLHTATFRLSLKGLPMTIFSTSAKLLMGAAIGVAVLTGCNKKAEDMPAPTASQAANPNVVPDPDMTKPGTTAGGTTRDANPGGTTGAPATPVAPDPNSTAQPPSSTTSTNQ